MESIPMESIPMESIPMALNPISLNPTDYYELTKYDNKTSKFTLNGYKTYAKCVSVYDGDTIHVVFKMSETNNYHRWIIRMSGIDTPEIRTKNTAEKNKAIEVRDYLRNKILDKIIILECLDFDKYGRLLGNIFIINENITLNQQLINNGMAKIYNGGTKEDWE